MAVQAYLTTEHPDYSILAARIAVSNLHKMTDKSFSAVMTACYNKVDKSSGCSPMCPLPARAHPVIRSPSPIPLSITASFSRLLAPVLCPSV
jgi:hypothetical protein